MKSKILKTFLGSFQAFLAAQPDVCASGTQFYSVWWVVTDGEWRKPCWIDIREHGKGCIRIISKNNPGMPKSAWPYARSPFSPEVLFELTFHPSELTKATEDLIYQCCSRRNFLFASPLFAETGAVPAFAWTLKARAHQEGRKVK